MSETYIGAAKFRARLERLGKSLEGKPCSVCGKPIGKDGASIPFGNPPVYWCAEHAPSFITRADEIADKEEEE